MNLALIGPEADEFGLGQNAQGRGRNKVEAM